MFPFKKVVPDCESWTALRIWSVQSCLSSKGQEEPHYMFVQLWENYQHQTKVLPFHFADRHNWQNRSWEIQPCSGVAETGGSCRRSHPNWWTGYCPARSPWPQNQDHCHSPGRKLISKILEQRLEHLERVYKESVREGTLSNFQVGNNLYTMFICCSI